MVNLKLTYIKNTGNGKKYSDENGNEYYVEDNIEDIGVFKLTNVKTINDQKIKLYFDRLESKPESHFKYKSE